MALEIPENVRLATQEQYDLARTKANSFMNRNWAWVVPAACAGFYCLGLLRGWPIF